MTRRFCDMRRVALFVVALVLIGAPILSAQVTIEQIQEAVQSAYPAVRVGVTYDGAGEAVILSRDEFARVSDTRITLLPEQQTVRIYQLALFADAFDAELVGRTFHLADTDVLIMPHELMNGVIVLFAFSYVSAERLLEDVHSAVDLMTANKERAIEIGIAVNEAAGTTYWWLPGGLVPGAQSDN